MYKQIFIDFDGVICDTNRIKKNNIFNATKKVTDLKTAKLFTNYFISNNGLPREYKLNLFFKDKKIEYLILTEYILLNKNLIHADIASGLENFLKKNKQSNIYILSGGSLEEITEFLKFKSIDKYFTKILCGPLTKKENFRLLCCIKM